MFTPRSTNYNLRGHHILSLSKPRTTVYSLHSFNYLAAKLWNSLSDGLELARIYMNLRGKFLVLSNMYFHIYCKLHPILFFISYFINVSFDRHVNLIFLLSFVFSLYFIIYNTKTLALCSYVDIRV